MPRRKKKRGKLGYSFSNGKRPSKVLCTIRCDGETFYIQVPLTAMGTEKADCVHATRSVIPLPKRCKIVQAVRMDGIKQRR
jgi:hypothetical protein